MDYAETLRAEAERLGLTDCRVEKPKRGHPRFYFRRPDGTERYVPFPCTPSDAMRGAKNSVRDLRHAAGIIPHGKKGERRERRTKAKSARTEHIPVTAVKPDPFAALAAMSRTLEMEARMRRRARRRARNQ